MVATWGRSAWSVAKVLTFSTRASISSSVSVVWLYAAQQKLPYLGGVVLGGLGHDGLYLVGHLGIGNVQAVLAQRLLILVGLPGGLSLYLQM